MAILDDLKAQRGLTVECPSCSNTFRASEARLFDATKKLSGDALDVLEALKEQLADARLDLRRRKVAAQEKSQKGARAVNIGNVVEKIAPTLPGFTLTPADCRMLSEPIDLVVFRGYAAQRHVEAIDFVEIKSGRSKLSSEQRAIRKVVEAGSVELVVTNASRTRP
ncbi:MAG TPA: Holliday junction resolvase-like protein [Kofleriaceae bacterium]|nr:Holliday junction resolvase-like protein [Kofleriaceae bacterium]